MVRANEEREGAGPWDAPASLSPWLPRSRGGGRHTVSPPPLPGGDMGGWGLGGGSAPRPGHNFPNIPPPPPTTQGEAGLGAKELYLAISVFI